MKWAERSPSGSARHLPINGEEPVPCVGMGLLSRRWRGDEMGLDQPLRRCAPPPHKWGGASSLRRDGSAWPKLAMRWTGLRSAQPPLRSSAAGLARHLPFCASEPPAFAALTASLHTALPTSSGAARHLPINGEEPVPCVGMGLLGRSWRGGETGLDQPLLLRAP